MITGNKPLLKYQLKKVSDYIYISEGIEVSEKDRIIGSILRKHNSREKTLRALMRIISDGTPHFLHSQLRRLKK